MIKRAIPFVMALFVVTPFFYSVIAVGSELPSIFEDRERTLPLKYTTLNQVRISSCKADNRCVARRVAANQLRFSIPSEIKWGRAGKNPASTICKLIRGVPGTIYKGNLDEISICRFRDQSFIFGWDLMRLSKSWGEGTKAE
jgi:hypothetical protein